MGIRVVVVDDNPHVRWEGRVYPVNATFHRFLAAVLDVPGAPISSITHCVPLRDARIEPATLPLDERLEVVATAPFDGIAGYLRHAPRLIRANRRVLAPAIAAADVAWIKVPASNAPLAGWLARRSATPRLGYVAGSALAVARARRLGLRAQVVGVAYDVAGRLAAGSDRVVVGRGIADATGIVTSLVEASEIRDVSGAPWPSIPWRLRLSWAGRLAPGKGVETLIDALALTVRGEVEGHRTELVVIGDGPARRTLEARAVRAGIGDRIHWLGYIADRGVYLDALAATDLFVFPSPAEGFPKVVLDAMAAGLPVVAASTGTIRELRRQVELVPPADPAALAGTIRALLNEPSRAIALRAAGRELVRAHTRETEAARVAARLVAAADVRNPHSDGVALR
jgi:glycosyltransferase involved in cell wall biosynthesis